MQRTTERQLTPASLLERYPWSREETGGRRPMDYLWKFSLQVSPEDLWPFLIDTSTFNKLLGLPVMTYEEKNGRLFGKSVNAGVLSEWEEVPWEWEYLKGLNSARIYSRGFATYVRSRYIIEPTAQGTDLYVYFGWVPRSLTGRLLLKIGMPRLRDDYEKALAKVVSIIRERGDFESRQRALFLAAQHEAVEPAGIERLRLHFQKTYEIVRTFNGAVVKTIGDSAMVAFTDSLQCLRAAVELQKCFTGNPETGNVLLRISIHAGPCLAVNLNSGVDYFGNTVNFAAKLQQLAGAREIAFSRDFEQDPRIAGYLRQLGLQPEIRTFQPSWASRPYEVPVLKIGDGE